MTPLPNVLENKQDKVEFFDLKDFQKGNLVQQFLTLCEVLSHSLEPPPTNFDQILSATNEARAPVKEWNH
jgi:hypothetical protein